MVRLAPYFPEITTAITIRRHLQEIVEELQCTLLQKLPDGAKLSIALDCWTPPFHQAFMAITVSNPMLLKKVKHNSAQIGPCMRAM
jgi:hypothetical protein